MSIQENGYRCTACSRTYALSDRAWRCACGGLFDLEVASPRFPETLPDLPWSQWRYQAAITVPGPPEIWQRITLGEGMTPLVRDGRGLLLKLDFVMPTGSYKDRGGVLLLSKAVALGSGAVVVDSSGNAGVSVAAYSARAGLAAEVFVPVTTSMKKVRQTQKYGATVHRVDGDRSDAAEAAIDRVETSGACYASHVYDPYFYQGTKTVAYEIWEQLDRRAPDTIVLPVGNGTLVLGVALGFGELVNAGLAHQVPRIVAVQAERCAPLATAYDAGLPLGALRRTATAAEGIAIAEPARAAQILEVVRASSGYFLTAQESDLAPARLALAETGIDVEPTAAAAFAAWTASADASEGSVVVVLTGSGLKSP